MKKAMKKLACLALAFVMAMSIIVVVSPSDTSAARVNKVTANKNYKKAPALKTGNNKVTVRSNWDYVKFKAPKKGTYVFTFTDIQSTDTRKEDGYGSICFGKPYGNYIIDYINVKTNGGNEIVYLNMCTIRRWRTTCKKQYKDPTSDYTYKRTATITLKKGETVYLSSSFYGKKPKFNYMVNIKKK